MGMAENVFLNFGLVRGLAYYNGIVFEVKHDLWPGSIGGGGRYDDLATALGSDERIPALGFAYNLEGLLSVATHADVHEAFDDRRAALGHPQVLIFCAELEHNQEALSIAMEMRGQGITVEIAVDTLDLDSAIVAARQRGIGKVVLAGTNGVQTTYEVE